MKVAKIFLGFEYSPKPDWQELMPPPKKPSNWKQETYEDKLPELREKQKETAAQHLMAGSVNRACAIMQVEDSQVVKLADGVTGRELTKILAKEVHSGEADVYHIFGFETLESLRLCAWDPLSCRPAWIWNTGIRTPVTLINLYSCSGAKQAGISLTEMLDYWIAGGLTSDGETNAAGEIFGESNADVATNMACAAYLIATYFGLIYHLEDEYEYGKAPLKRLDYLK